MHTADKNIVLETFFSSMSAYLSVVRSLSSRSSDELWNPFSKLETRTPQRFSSAATATCEGPIKHREYRPVVAPVQIKIKLC